MRDSNKEIELSRMKWEMCKHDEIIRILISIPTTSTAFVSHVSSSMI